MSIPPLLIQPLVENAIRHGIGNRIEGGTVKLTAFEADGEYWFVIADNGVQQSNALALVRFGVRKFVQQLALHAGQTKAKRTGRLSTLPRRKPSLA
ncbi:hypothetical protein ABEO98_10345 [Brevibacillus parabrevis]|uniref:sensor histidine kinase n=1 Tax=Brevibacillus parabrevis TaxID=54914 RepID=UPI002E22906F|nr:hypothetical protein [Brevibacillus parabrevis]